MEKTLDIHIFCAGSILKKGHGKKPSNKVYEKPFSQREGAGQQRKTQS